MSPKAFVLSGWTESPSVSQTFSSGDTLVWVLVWPCMKGQNMVEEWKNPSAQHERPKKVSAYDDEDSKHVEFDPPSKTWAGLKNRKWWPACYRLIINSATAVSSTSGEPTQDLLKRERWTPSVSNLLFRHVCVSCFRSQGVLMGGPVRSFQLQPDESTTPLGVLFTRGGKNVPGQGKFKNLLKNLLIDVLLFHASDQWLSWMNNSRH